MRAVDIMSRHVVTVPPGMPLPEAWTLMQQRRIRHLPVVDGARLVGLLCDRDILLNAVRGPAGGIVVVRGVVGAAMVVAPAVCVPTTPVPALAQRMIDHRIHALPVVASIDDPTLLGIVTSTDLFWLLVDDGRVAEVEAEGARAAAP
jgi:acetoin utilization protein AcuB